MTVEARPFLVRMDNLRLVNGRSYKTYEGSLLGKSVVLTISGVGIAKAKAASEALLLTRPSCLIVSGVAGATEASLGLTETVVATETVYHDLPDQVVLERCPDLTNAVFQSDPVLLDRTRKVVADQPTSQPVRLGRIASGASFVTKSQRAKIIERTNPIAVDMETAAAAEVCHLHKVPFLAVRSISDTADNASFLNFLKYARPAAKNAFEVTALLLSAL
jgi:adenosylhomocysteine nucleosidase